MSIFHKLKKGGITALMMFGIDLVLSEAERKFRVRRTKSLCNVQIF